MILLGLVLIDSGRTFAQGWEYYYLGGDTARFWDASRLRVWRLGSQLWCPVSGGLRILGQDLDLDDDGWLDIPLASAYEKPSWIAWGPDFAGRTPLNPGAEPAIWAQGICVADIDGDGLLELSVANEHFLGPQISYIYKVEGREVYPIDSVPEGICVSPQGLHFADLNNDGYVDLVISNHQTQDWQANINSYVLLGPGPFWDKEPDYALPTYGGHLTQIADINGDGWLDVLFSSNRADGEGWQGWIVIYWGGPFGWGVWDTTMLPVNNNWETQMADLNNDGWLDIVAVCGKDSVGYHTYDKIFWGPSFSMVSLLPGLASSNVSVADLNLDGTLDLVLSSWATGTHGNETLGVYSYVYYGPNYPSGPHDSLWGWGGHGNLVADFNDDGWPDVFLGCEMTRWGDVFAETSYVYWGGESGLGEERLPVEAWGFNDGIWLDLGHVYDRAPRFRYLSRVFEADTALELKELLVFGNFPPGTEWEAWARAGEGDSWGPWVRAEELGKGAVVGRRFQYRLVITTDFKATSLVSVDSVKLALEPAQEARESPSDPDLWYQGNRLIYRAPAPAWLRIYNSAGRLVLSERVAGSGSVSVGSLKRGAYWAFLGKVRLHFVR